MKVPAVEMLAFSGKTSEATHFPILLRDDWVFLNKYFSLVENLVLNDNNATRALLQSSLLIGNLMAYFVLPDGDSIDGISLAQI